MNSKILLFVVAFVFSFQTYAEKITKTYNFEKPRLENDGDFTKIIYKNCHNFGPEGAPAMPLYAADLLLPAGHEIVSIKVEEVTYYDPIENIVIAPAERQFPLSQKPTEKYVVKPDQRIYQSENVYPSNQIDNQITQFLAGHAIGGFTVCPVSYFPNEKKAEIISSISVTIETRSTKRSKASLANLKGNIAISNRLEKIVENPGKLSSYSYPESKTTGDIDLLIITNQELMPGFEDYVNYKTSVGFIVEVKDIEEIYSEYTGVDDAEKVRNCIIDYYQNNNLTYVVLGGDADGNTGGQNIVPARGMYANAYSTPDDFVPADIYYSCLDGNWDNDNDGIYGEEGEEDLLAEVFVGRICVDNVPELEKFINKIIMYQDQPVVDDIEKSLMLGELLWDDPTWGGDYKDEVADGADTQGYTTEGISDNFTITRLYERDADWSHQDVFDQFNNTGINLLNHLGHCNVDYHMTMYNDDITTSNFQNNGIDRGFVIDYSQGCYCGSFDNRGTYSYGNVDCFAEEFTNFENGPVACIHNSRYGWGQHSSTDGASQYFDRQFFDAIFGENITIIGEANADSKSDNLAYIDSHEGAIRWCVYQITLFGDPSMDIWTAQPTNFAATYDNAIYLGSSQVSVNTGVAGARIALMQNGELIGRAVADESGNALVETFTPVADPNPITITITGHNKNKHEGTIVILSDAPYVGLNQYTIVGTPDYGATVTMDVKFKNYASAGSGYDANGVIAKLRTTDTHVTINDSIVDLGSIIAGDSVEVSDAFEFTFADSILDQHTVNFEVIVTGSDKEDYSWTSYAFATANAPELIVGSLNIDDTGSGNGDGILDPGETADLKITLNNVGHAAISNTMSEISITGGGEYLTLTNTSYTIGDINAEGSVEAIFEATAEATAPLGTPVDLLFSATGASSGQYMASEEKQVIIGFIPEYCESGATNSADTEIDEVAYGNMVNNTAGDCATYNDYTENEEFIEEFMLGSTFNISLTLGTCGGDYTKGAKVYVDWNYDGDFEDENEMVFETPSADGTETFTSQITVPGDVPLGQKFLRVVCSENEGSISPCGTFSYGETEDYKIFLVAPEPPIADFEATPTETTQGDVVEFTDLTTNAPIEWAWSITPGTEGTDYIYVNETTSASRNPQVQFMTTDTYSVELTAANIMGSDTETKNDYITINPVTAVPEANFEVDLTVVNPGNTVHFNDLSTNTPTAWQWNITPGTEGTEFNFVEGTSAGSQNPAVAFNTPGFYTIQLVASNVIGDSDPYTETDLIEVLTVFIMTDGNATTCSGTFYDDGGADGEYSDGANFTMTFYPATSGKMLQFNFSEFSVEEMSSGGCYDDLTIYDGESTSAEMIGEFCDNNPVEIVTATNSSGALTFVFSSDGSVTQSGWVAEINCVDPAESYTLTFNVTDGTNAIEGATINIASQALTTNASGEATINLVDGVYDYTLTASGYEQTTGTVTIAGADVTENITIVPIVNTYAVTFEVTANGSLASGAQISCDGHTMTTNDEGQASIEMEAGEYSYSVTMEGYGEESGTFTVVDQNITVNIAMVGMNDISSIGLNLYPNPNDGTFTIQINGIYKVSILNAMGEVIHTQNIQNEGEINLNDVSEGVYFIRLTNGQKSATQRFIISK